MCKGGSNATTTTTQPPPQVMQQYQNVQNQANTVAQNPYYFYPGTMVAGMSPDQMSGIGATAGFAGAMENPANTYGMAQPFINQAGAMTAAGASPVTGGEINQYMNPYLQQVGQTTMAEMNQQNLMQQNALGGSAAASGALGGDRIGIARAALANQQDMAENAALANINAQGFNTALGAAQTTKGQQLQGGFLQGQTGQLAEDAALTGMTAPLNAAEGWAGSMLPVGSQYGTLGTTAENAALSGLNAGMTGAGQQFNMGTAEQQQQQNQINAAMGQWLGSVQYPYQNTNFLSGIQTGLGSLEGGTSTTTPPKPSLFSQILGDVGSLAGIAGGIMSMKRGGRAERAFGGPAGAAPPHVAMPGPVRDALFAAMASQPSAQTQPAVHPDTLPPTPPPLKPPKQGGASGGMAGLASGGRVAYAVGGFTPQVANVGMASAVDNPMMQNDKHAEIPTSIPIARSANLPSPPPVPQSGQKGDQAASAINAVKGAVSAYNKSPWAQNAFGSSFTEPSAAAIMAGTAPLYREGGRVGRAYGGSADAIPTPLSEEILDYNMMSQLMPGGQVRKTRYQAPEGEYAAGGAVEPEGAGDIGAQLAAMDAPGSSRRAVFAPAGSKVPANLPAGVGAARRPEGILLSRDRALLHHYATAPKITDKQMAGILGYPQSKAQAGSNAAVVRSMYGAHPAYETAVSPNAVNDALAMARAHGPGGRLEVTTPEAAIAQRKARSAFAAGGAPAPQGPSGISSMALVPTTGAGAPAGVGNQADLNLPGAGGFNPATWGGFAAPQAHGLDMSGFTPGAPPAPPVASGLSVPGIGAEANFAPVQFPGGTSSGPVTGPAGVPEGYISAIEQASPYFNPTSAPTAPSSGLKPYSPIAPAAPVAPTVQQNLAPFSTLADYYSNIGAKRGGRVPKAGGGPLGFDYVDPMGAHIPTPNLPAPDVGPVGAPQDLLPAAQPKAEHVPPLIGAKHLSATPFGPPGLPQFHMEAAPAPGGVDPNAYYSGFAKRQDAIESGGDPLATNPNSTAVGAGQFTDGTWLGLMDQVARPYSVSHSPKDLLALRTNPRVSLEATEAYARENAVGLEKAGLPVSYTNLDLAHRFGLMGAQDIISAPGNTPAASILPDKVIAANPELRNMTTGQIVEQAGVAMGAAAQKGTEIAQNGTSDVGDASAGLAPRTPVSPFSLPANAEGAIQSSQSPVGQIPVPHTTALEKMLESPWMMLADAGFNMMAGTSPFPSVNIGQGAHAGLEFGKSMLAQQRARQRLQADVRAKNVGNVLKQRQQGLQGVTEYNQAASNANAGIGEMPALQGAQILHGTMPGVSAPPNIPGVAAPGAVPPVGAGANAVPPFDAAQATGLPPAAPTPPASVVGPTGAVMPYRDAVSLARKMQLSKVTQPAATEWLSLYGGQNSNAELKALVDTASAAAVQRQQLDELRPAANEFLTGPGAETRSHLLKVASTVASAINEPLPKGLEDATTASQIIPKIATFIQSGLTRMASDRGGAVVMQEVMAATPNMTNTRQGIDKLIGLYDTLAVRTQSMSRYVTAAVQGGDMTYQQAVNAFNEQYPPSMWASRVDPIPLPSDTSMMHPGFVYTAGGAPGLWNGQQLVPLPANEE